MPKFHFIVNPIAGTGRSDRLFNEAKAILDDRGVEYSVAYSEYPTHAVELAKAAAKNGETHIVAVGGDGTISEVSKSLVGVEGVTMGVFPFGTGNDLARALNIPSEAEGAVDVLLNGEVRSMDMGSANGAMFANVGGFGFDTDVVIYTEKFKKRFNGMLPYMLGVMQSLLHLKPIKMHINADGEEFDEEALLFAAANGTHYGGGMNVAPLADPFDGSFDVCIVKKIGVLTLLTVLPVFIKGKHLKNKHIRYMKAKSVKIDCVSGVQLNLDGELGSVTPVTFSILENAIKIIVPKKAESYA